MTDEQKCQVIAEWEGDRSWLVDCPDYTKDLHATLRAARKLDGKERFRIAAAMHGARKGGEDFVYAAYLALSRVVVAKRS